MTRVTLERDMETMFPVFIRGMMRRARLPLMMSLWAMASCGSRPTDIDLSKGVRVLFIGNSLTFTNDLPGLVEALIDSAALGPVTIESITFGNVGLEDHWNRGQAREAIARGGWDVVVLQQGPSATEGRPSLLEYSERFAEEAERVGARVALYMVWPSAARFFDFDGVSESYAMAAGRVNGLLFPAGEAWRVAWESDPSLPLYGRDGFHPSVSGSYLAALVMFQQLTGASPNGLPATLELSSGRIVSVNLPTEKIALLQGAAVEANERFGLP
jgi:hypothetical protein